MFLSDDVAYHHTPLRKYDSYIIIKLHAQCGINLIFHRQLLEVVKAPCGVVCYSGVHSNCEDMYVASSILKSLSSDIRRRLFTIVLDSSSVSVGRYFVTGTFTGDANLTINIIYSVEVVYGFCGDT